MLAGIAETAPYLWDLSSADLSRASLLLIAGPGGRACRAAGRDARRRGGGLGTRPTDAYSAPHEGGGSAADRACRHRRRLAAGAGHPRAHRRRRDGAWRGGRVFSLPTRPTAASSCRSIRNTWKPVAATSCWRWARWGPMSSISRAISISWCFSIRARPHAPRTSKPAPLYVRLTRDLVKLLQERTADGYVFRVDLRLRPDPSSTQIAISRRSRARLLRKQGTELGARGADQGAAMRRRHGRRRTAPPRPRRPSSGANISTSRPSPTSTR